MARVTRTLPPQTSPLDFPLLSAELAGALIPAFRLLDHFYVAPDLGSPITIRCRTFGAAAP